VLLVNEIAPRVHNTGHWTQDGCVCDQFEQHIRAIAGWPLGPTTAHARVEMTNLLGDAVDQWAELAAKPDARLHLYGKADARPGRKMAHVNRVLGKVSSRRKPGPIPAKAADERSWRSGPRSPKDWVPFRTSTSPRTASGSA
jgi:phosphoribosylaminoimidazole carboxylase (NCAIR synthetase)